MDCEYMRTASMRETHRYRRYLRRRLLLYVVDRVVLVEQLLRFLLPGMATPFIIELCPQSDNWGNLEDE